MNGTLLVFLNIFCVSEEEYLVTYHCSVRVILCFNILASIVFSLMIGYVQNVHYIWTRVVGSGGVNRRRQPTTKRIERQSSKCFREIERILLRRRTQPFLKHK